MSRWVLLISLAFGALSISQVASMDELSLVQKHAAKIIENASAVSDEDSDTTPECYKLSSAQVVGPKCCTDNPLGKDYSEFDCAAGHTAGDYALGPVGQVDCPPGYAYLNDMSECKTAASMYGSKWGTGVNVYKNEYFPSGCISWWPSSDQINWIQEGATHNEGGWNYGPSHAYNRRVCKKSTYTHSEFNSNCPVGYGQVEDRQTCIGAAATEIGKDWGGDSNSGNLASGCVIQPQMGYPGQYIMFNTGGDGVKGFLVCQPTTTTTTTTVLSLNGLDTDEKAEEIMDEQSKTYDCAKWCRSKKHANKPWIGGKCDWYACRTCEECGVR